MAITDRPRVLIIDDNEATCDLVTAILQRDFTVETAGDGLEGVERLKTKSYHVILLDLRMPHSDGFHVLDHLSTHSAETLGRVIVMTASVTDGDLSRVRRYPVASIITKPFEVDVLLASVKSCAGGSGPSLTNVFSSGMVLLLADLIRQRWF